MSQERRDVQISKKKKLTHTVFILFLFLLECDSHHPRERRQPQPLDLPELPTFCSISSGRQHLLGLADNGSLYEWYSWSRLMRIVGVPWKRLTQIVSGWNLSSALTSSGQVYIWRQASEVEVRASFEGIEIELEQSLVLDLDSSDRMIKCPELSERPIKIVSQGLMDS